MPEVFPSPDQGANIDRCWTCRSMFMQAWGNYGTAWSVVHQQLGVRPFLGYGAVQVIPQVPDGQPSVSGSNIRIGNGSVDVFAAHGGSRYTTELQVHGLRLTSLQIGATLPAGATVRTVRIDGSPAHGVAVRHTNRGTEVAVSVRGSQPHTLVVTTG
jgi:hypothetical protein